MIVGEETFHLDIGWSRWESGFDVFQILIHGTNLLRNLCWCDVDHLQCSLCIKLLAYNLLKMFQVFVEVRSIVYRYEYW